MKASTIYTYAVIALVILMPILSSAEIVSVTGVAIKIKLENANQTQLRDIAIRNAMEKALVQVNGVQISSSKSQLSTSKDEFKLGENASYEQSLAFQSGDRTRYSGNVKIVKFIKEWEEEESYFVKLKINVLSEGNGKVNTGTLWQRVNKPSLSLKYIYQFNGARSSYLPKMESYIRDNISRNGLELSSSKHETRYAISTQHSVATSIFSSLNTYKANCEINYQVLDNEVGRSIKDASFRAGPEAGFSASEAVDNCNKQLSSKIVKKLIAQLGEVFNEEWINGKEYKITLEGVSGNQVTVYDDILRGAYLVKSSSLETFNNSNLLFKVVFSGGPIELTDSVAGVFYLHGHLLELMELNQNKIKFKISTDK